MSEKKEDTEDAEMLKHLDLLLNMEVLEEEDSWDEISENESESLQEGY